MIKKIMKYIILYGINKKVSAPTQSAEVNNKNLIKREIIRLLELINIRINKLINNILLSRKRLLSRINKLEKLNHINDYKLISYNFNKNSMIIKSILSKLIIKLLENIINGVDLKSVPAPLRGAGKLLLSTAPVVTGTEAGGNIIISKPVIKENLNEVNILFYYFIPNNKSYKYFSRINMFLNKIKNYKELVKFSKNYSKSSYILHDKLIVSNIFNNIINNRNNVKYINKNVKNLINDLNNNYNTKSILLLKKSLSNNINNINKLPSKLLINSTLLNVSILNKKVPTVLKDNENKELLNDNNSIINNNIFSLLNNNYKKNGNNLINNIYKNVINTNKLVMIKKCNIHSKVKLERKDLVLNYLLKNEIISKKIEKVPSYGVFSDTSSENIDLLKINKINDKTNIYGYMVSYIDILLGNIINKNNKSNDIKMIISKYFGLKEVNISGINLKYEFNNPEILLKLIRKGISKRKRTLSRMFRFRLKNRIPLLNDKGILKNKISNNLLKNLSLNNNILNVEYNIKKVLFNSINIKKNINIYNDIKDYYNNLLIDNDKDLILNNEILYKNIVGWSLLLKGKVGARKGKNRSNRILMTKGSFKNNNLYIYNILEDNSNNNGYSKDRLKLNYIKNSNFISYMDKSTNNIYYIIIYIQ